LSCSTFAADKTPLALEGLLDLSEWNFDTDGNVEIKGDFEFYWSRFLSRQELLTAQTDTYAGVPRPWNDIVVGRDTVTGHGYATYRLNILIPSDAHSCL